jgi:glutamate dehydrogenase (NADP+)
MPHGAWPLDEEAAGMGDSRTTGNGQAEVDREVEHFMEGLTRRNPHEPAFHQAVHEVVETLMPFLLEHSEYRDAQVLERLTEPDRIITWRVAWEKDDGSVRVNRAWRVQFSNAIGPYKGGLRFAPNVDAGVLKFLGFEQCFKNALTGLPMGGAKGGSNFAPKGRSEREVMRFCQSMMTELHRHIGEDTDVPAGDIGVGGRELGFLFGQYRRMENRFSSILTGKGLAFGGSEIRIEATGYGCVYFAGDMLDRLGDGIDGKRCLISGSGNVALYAAEKVRQLGGTVLTLSDSDGTICDPDGIDEEKLAWLIDLKISRRGRLREYTERFGGEYLEGRKPWAVPADLAFPCATQNELDETDAKALIDGGCRLVAEGANMPCTPEAVERLREAGVLYAPGKAANAGGVAVSGLEQSQNALRISWTREEVDSRLQTIMSQIHGRCVEYGEDGESGVDYVRGANLAGFLKLGTALLAQGVG